MKKLLIAAILLVSIAGFAQDKKDGSKRPQKANMEKLTLKSELKNELQND
jgi:hypothetical protein